MKFRHFARAATLALALGLGSQSWAIPVSTVGTQDLLRGSAALGNSSETQEAGWASSVLGFAVTFDGKVEGSSSWQAVDGVLGGYALDFGAGVDPAYYLVKTGKGSTIGPGHTHFLFENLNALRFAFITLTQIGFDPARIDVTKISHTTRLDGPTQVAEPASLALFGLGLLALVLARRRVTAR